MYELAARPPCDLYRPREINLWSSSYRFRDKRRFLSRIAIFPPLVFNAPARGVFQLEFCNSGRAQKLEYAPTRMSTRNSAIADKPRDAVVQRAMAWLTSKTRPSPYVLPRQIWSFYVKGCGHKQRETAKSGKRWDSAPLGRRRS